MKTLGGTENEASINHPFELVVSHDTLEPAPQPARTQKFLHGVNIRLGSHSAQEYLERMKSIPPETLMQLASSNQLATPEEIQTFTEKPTERPRILAEVAQRLAKMRINEEIERLRTAKELHPRYVRIHFENGPLSISNILLNDKAQTNELLELIDELYHLINEANAYLEISLGPGLVEYKDSNGNKKTNSTLKAVKREDGTVEYTNEEVPTEYHIPTEDAEIEAFVEYAKIIYERYPNAVLSIWNEPNFNTADHGIILDETRSGQFTSEGRVPEHYARLVGTVAESLRRHKRELSDTGKDYPTPTIGIDVAFVDTDYIKEILQTQTANGHKIADIIQFVSVHPYKGYAKPTEPGPTWRADLDNKHPNRTGRFTIREISTPDNYGQPSKWSEHGTYMDELRHLFTVVNNANPDLFVIAGEMGYSISDIRRRLKSELVKLNIEVSGEEFEAIAQMRMQAYALQTILIHKASALPTAWWQLSAEGDYDYNLIDKTQPTPLFQTLARINKRLLTTETEPLGYINTGNQETHCLAFREHDNLILAIWNNKIPGIDSNHVDIQIASLRAKTALNQDLASIIRYQGGGEVSQEAIPLTDSLFIDGIDEVPTFVVIPIQSK